MRPSSAMRSGLRDSLDLAGSSLEPVLRRLSPSRLAVLAYHEVADTVQFRDHVDHLCRYYEPIGLADLERAPRSLPRNAVLITFDDGHRSVLEVAMPVLQRAGIQGVAFVTAGLLDSDRAPWWVEVEILATRLGRDGGSELRRLKRAPDAERLRTVKELRNAAGTRIRASNLMGDEVRELDAAGIRVENHTWSHPLLDRCSVEKIRSEISRAGEHLRELLGRPVRAIAYPNGNVDARVLRVAAELGYEYGFLFDHRLAAEQSDPLMISRLRVDATASLPRFRSIVGGLHPYLHGLRGLP